MADKVDTDFVQLITQNQRVLFGYILTLVPQWSDAEDILQKTNMRLWEEMDRFEPGSHFTAWATKVAYYEVMSWRNSVSRSKLVFDTALIEDLAKRQHELSDQLQARRVALAHCMEQLSQSQLDLLRRVYAEHSRIKDVASSLGRSAESMYKVLQRLRLLLHDCVKRRLQATESQ